MSNEIIEFYKNANKKTEEQSTLNETISSLPVVINDPFGNFLLELSDKLKNVSLESNEKLDIIQEVVTEEKEKNSSDDTFSSFLDGFANILSKEINKKQDAVKNSAIDFISNLKEQKTKPTKPVKKKIPNKFADKIKIKEPIIENEIKPEEVVDKNNTYVDQLKSIDKSVSIPEKVKTKTDIKSFIAKQVKDEIEKFKVQFSKLAIEGGGGSVATQYAKGGTMDGDLNVTGKYLSGGVDLSSLIGTGGGGGEADRLISGSQSLILNTDGTLSFPSNFIVPPDGEILNIESETNTSELSGFTRISLSPFGFFAYDNNNNSISFSTTDNDVVIASQDQYEWKFNSEGIFEGPFGTLTVNGLSSIGEILSGGVPLHNIFLTAETDSQTLTFTESSAELSISNSNSISLSSLNDKDYVNSNFLRLSGGTISGNLTIQGNISALGTATFANTIFTTTSALSVYNTGPGPALYVYQAAGPYDVASFYDGDGIEVLHVGNSNVGGLGRVGVNVSTPNTELTVQGSISANDSIYANVYLSGGINLFNILSSSGGGITTDKRFDYITIDNIDYSYSGTAIQGTEETSSTWKIVRLTYNSNGTIFNQASAIDSWTGRLTASYF